VTVTLAVVEDPPYAAVRVTNSELEVAPAVPVNDAEVDPAGTPTAAGTDRHALLLASDTETPPLGAAPLRLTAQVVVL